MSLLKYFQPENVTASPEITSRESREVEKQLSIVQEKGRKRKKYRMWTPEERAEIGKYAYQHGNKATLHKMHQKYPELKHQTVTDFHKAYRTDKERKNNVEVFIYASYLALSEIVTLKKIFHTLYSFMVSHWLLNCFWDKKTSFIDRQNF